MANTTLSVALLSGKGGVGKTNMSLNMACALHQMGFKTLLMDCDLGLANLDVLLGITPEGNLQTALMGEAEISEVLHEIDGEGFAVLPAASGVPELTELQPDARDLLLARLEPVLHNYDYVFMDVGAGISGTVQTFAAMASVRIVVITPEPTSLTDSYALIKVLNNRYGLRDFMRRALTTKRRSLATGWVRASSCRAISSISFSSASMAASFSMTEAALPGSPADRAFPASSRAIPTLAHMPSAPCDDAYSLMR